MGVHLDNPELSTSSFSMFDLDCKVFCEVLVICNTNIPTPPYLFALNHKRTFFYCISDKAMAPKDGTSSPRKTTSRQTKLSFKPTKRDAAPLKAKTKSKSKQAKPPPSDSESESSVSGINETSGANADPAVLDVHDKARRYKRYYDETRALMNHKAPSKIE